jgi:excisionase family DNA binding protein
MSDLTSERLLSVNEAADVLGFKPDTIYKLIADQRLDAVKLGGGRKPRLRIPASALDRYCLPAAA